MSILQEERVPPHILEQIGKLTPEQRQELLRLARPRLVEPYIKHIPHPVQQVFLNVPSEEAMYGGAAGGGKSDALLMAALQYVDVPGYSALILRRTWPDLNAPGAILDRARTWLGDTPARPRDGGRIWEFPTANESVPARIQFGYLQHDKDKYKFQSAEYQFVGFDELTHFEEDTYNYLFSRIRRPQINCLNCNTALRAYRNKAGSVYYKHVTASGKRRCKQPFADPKTTAQYSAAPDGTTIFDVPLRMRSACVDQGEVLTTEGWKDIKEVREGDLVYSMSRDGILQVKRVLKYHEYDNDKPMVRVRKKNLYMSMTYDHRVTYQRFGSMEYDTDPWNEHTGRSISVARAPEGIEQTGWSNPNLGWDTDTYLSFLGLYLAEGCTNTTVRNGNYKTVITQCSTESAKIVAELFDALPYSYSHSSNGDFQITNKRVWEHFTKFGKAHDKFVPRDILVNASYRQLRLLLKWLVFGDGHVRGDSIQYVTVSKQLADDVSEIGLRLGYKVMVTRKVLDDPDHRDRYTVYLTKDSLLTKVDKNETRNDVEEFDYDGKVYCIEVEDNHNFIIRQQGTVWVSGNTNPGGIGHLWVKAHFVDPATRKADAVFVPARLTDNPSLDQESYEKNLMHLSPVDRARLLEGDWDVDVDGAMFQRHWFNVISEVPVSGNRQTVRFWDLAASVNDGADYTVGAKVTLTSEGRWIIEDIVRLQGRPHEVERTILQTAMLDGQRVPIVMEQEPGSSGLNTISHYQRNILYGYQFRGERSSGSKESRAGGFSSAAEAGNVDIVRGHWNVDFLDEVTLFPNGAHDDQVDAVTGAFNVIAFGARSRLLA